MGEGGDGGGWGGGADGGGIDGGVSSLSSDLSLVGMVVW